MELKKLMTTGIIFLFIGVTVTPNTSSIPYPAAGFSLITIQIVATVTQVSDSYNLLGGVIQVNDTLTGKYMYDARATDWDPDSHNGTYWYTSSPCGFELKTSTCNFTTDPNKVNFAIVLCNDYSMNGSPPEDVFIVTSLKNLPLPNGLLITNIEWDLRDTTATALRNDDLPTTAPVLADWDSGQGLFIDGSSPSHHSQTFRITAHVTQATKNNAIHIFGNESAPSMILPNHYNIPFMQFWMRILERFRPHSTGTLWALI
jgi:hypothetical protein